MKKFLDYILDKNNRGVIGFALGIILVLLLLNQCNRIENLKQDVADAEQVANRNFNNYLASQDSIKLEKNINGDLVASISSYQYDIESLKTSNSKLLKKYNDALKLNEKFKQVNNLISAQLEIKDSIIAASMVTYNNDSIIIDLADNKEWDKYNWRNFKGQLVLYPQDSLFLVKRSIFEMDQGVSLTMAILNVDGKDQLKISSPYPNLTFTNIENINIVNDKLNRSTVKKSGWSIGLGVGYGINLNNQQVVSFGPSIGIGMIYSPKWLRF
jgi:hypothetical protein